MDSPIFQKAILRVGGKERVPIPSVKTGFFYKLPPEDINHSVEKAGEFDWLQNVIQQAHHSSIRAINEMEDNIDTQGISNATQTLRKSRNHKEILTALGHVLFAFIKKKDISDTITAIERTLREFTENADIIDNSLLILVPYFLDCGKVEKILSLLENPDLVVRHTTLLVLGARAFEGKDVSIYIPIVLALDNTSDDLKQGRAQATQVQEVATDFIEECKNSSNEKVLLTLEKHRDLVLDFELNRARYSDDSHIDVERIRKKDKKFS